MHAVIGLAGHVDHGKSTLVAALTGMQADRLREEQRREMTIDLGFTWLELPSGHTVSLIDVPGHERFIKNMLAGVGGIDAALLVVAADEGVMPQTREHLHILDLLEIEHGLVVLSKRDLVDEEWLALVEEDLRAALEETALATVPIVAVSARTGAGIDELRQALDALLLGLPARARSGGVPRLPIDRVFTVGGFGTVVTGTLLDGSIQVGQEVELLPRGLLARIRGLQTRHAKAEQALPGTRTAVNLAGVAVEDIRRGDLLTLPGAIRPTTLLDLHLRLVHDAPPLTHNTPLEVFAGAAEVPCHAALLDREVLQPGDSGWVQLRLQEPIAVVRGDRCIVRIPSPSRTIGGGRVVDAHPPRHRRFRPDVLKTLDTVAQGTPADLVAQALVTGGPHTVAALTKASSLQAEATAAAVAELVREGRAVLFGDENAITATTLIIGAAAWDALTQTMTTTLGGFHAAHPLRPGMARESLRQKLGLTNARLFQLVLDRAAAAGVLVATPTLAHLPGFTPTLSPAEQRQVASILEAFAAMPFSPPPRASWEALHPDLLALLLESGRLVRVSPDVVFASDAYTKLVEWTQDTLNTRGEVTVADLRDAFQTSRKYALAFLEHLDERKLTRRAGEVRVQF